MFIVNVYTQITRISTEMNKKQKSIQHLKEHSEWDRRGFLKILGIGIGIESKQMNSKSNQIESNQ